MSTAPGTALIAARPGEVADRIGAVLTARGLAVLTVEPGNLQTIDDGASDLRVAVWVAPAAPVAGRQLFAALDWHVAVGDHLESAFRLIRAAAAAMSHLEPVDGERGVAVLVAGRRAGDSLAHGTVLDAIAGMTFAAARDLADLKIRVVALVRDEEQDDDGDTAALVLHVLDNPMLNGLTLGARGRAPGGW